MRKKDKLTPIFKLWFKGRRSHIFGEGGAQLLEAIERFGSIAKAARRVGCSYKYAWDRISEMEKAVGYPIVKTTRGGARGGGAELTGEARLLLKEYSRLRSYLERVLPDKEGWERVGLKLSARNRLKGVVKKVERGDVSATVKIEIEYPATITAVITREAVDDLGIIEGDLVEAVIKSTEVMIAKE